MANSYWSVEDCRWVDYEPVLEAVPDQREGAAVPAPAGAVPQQVGAEASA